VKAPRFLFVAGTGRGAGAHPLWPGTHYPFEGEVDAEGSWVAWRLTGANHRELGRSARVFPDLAAARLDATTFHDRIGEAESAILTLPRTAMWGWRMTLHGLVIATSSRAYLRHRESAYSVTSFAAAVAAASLSEREPPRAWQVLSHETRDQPAHAPGDLDGDAVAPA
jgi:hypothetical protein